jgi:hypothetical protein
MMDRGCANAVIRTGRVGVGKTLARRSLCVVATLTTKKTRLEAVARRWCGKEVGDRVRETDSLYCARMNDARGRRGEEVVVVTSRAKTAMAAITEPPIHQRSS